MFLRCTKCEEIIASFDLKDLTLPLSGKMFKPIDSTYSKPFPEDLLWPDFHCPFCNYNPLEVTEEIAKAWVEKKGQGPSWILTDGGIVLIKSEPVKNYECSMCEKHFKSQNALNSHLKIHKKRRQLNV